MPELQLEEELAYRKAPDGRRGEVDALVPSGPFIQWLERTSRAGWTNRLTDSQQRYVERILKLRPDRVNVHSLDELFVQIDQPHLLFHLYPDG